MKQKGEMFICDACGETFVKDWSDGEALAEASAAFSPNELEDATRVCNDCWLEMRRVMPDLDARYGTKP